MRRRLAVFLFLATALLPAPAAADLVPPQPPAPDLPRDSPLLSGCDEVQRLTLRVGEQVDVPGPGAVTISQGSPRGIDARTRADGAIAMVGLRERTRGVVRIVDGDHTRCFDVDVVAGN